MNSFEKSLLLTPYLNSGGELELFVVPVLRGVALTLLRRYSAHQGGAVNAVAFDRSRLIA